MNLVDKVVVVMVVFFGFFIVNDLLFIYLHQDPVRFDTCWAELSGDYATIVGSYCGYCLINWNNFRRGDPHGRFDCYYEDVDELWSHDTFQFFHPRFFFYYPNYTSSVYDFLYSLPVDKKFFPVRVVVGSEDVASFDHFVSLATGQAGWGDLNLESFEFEDFMPLSPDDDSLRLSAQGNVNPEMKPTYYLDDSKWTWELNHPGYGCHYKESCGTAFYQVNLSEYVNKEDFLMGRIGLACYSADFVSGIFLVDEVLLPTVTKLGLFDAGLRVSFDKRKWYSPCEGWAWQYIPFEKKHVNKDGLLTVYIKDGGISTQAWMGFSISVAFRGPPVEKLF